MRYYIDTEFVDDGSTIDLISIGLVCEDGRELYLQSSEFDEHQANDWVKEHVISHLARCPWRTREQIKHELLTFMDIERYGKPELWGWCSAYDYVAFCQLFGTMMDLPAGYPHYIRDLQYVLDVLGIADEALPPQEEGAHNALEDARHIGKLWGYLICHDAWQ